MRYTSRSCGPLTPEERDVQLALTRHGCATDGATSRDWTPIAVLYQRYRTWYAEQNRWHYDPDVPALLTRRQFGHAIRRVYPGVRRCKRAVAARKKCWGYAFLAGDFATVTRRPRTLQNGSQVGRTIPLSAQS